MGLDFSTWLAQAADQHLYRSTQRINSGRDVLQRVYRPAGRSHVLKMRMCVYTPRRLQWIVLGCKRNLRHRQRSKLKSGVEDHLSSSSHSEEFDEQASNTGLPVLTLWLSPTQRYFLTFRYGVPRAVRCTWTKWQWKLVRSHYQHPSRTMSPKLWDRKGVPQHSIYLQDQMNLPHKSPRAYLTCLLDTTTG